MSALLQLTSCLIPAYMHFQPWSIEHPFARTGPPTIWPRTSHLLEHISCRCQLWEYFLFDTPEALSVQMLWASGLRLFLVRVYCCVQFIQHSHWRCLFFNGYTCTAICYNIIPKTMGKGLLGNLITTLLPIIPAMSNRYFRVIFVYHQVETLTSWRPVICWLLPWRRELKVKRFCLLYHTLQWRLELKVQGLCLVYNALQWSGTKCTRSYLAEQCRACYH